MKNFEIARLFDLMADVLEIKGENQFRIRAYRRAAQNLETLGEDVETLAREARLEEIPGVGKDVLDHLAAIELGVATARRAWLDKAGVVNTWPAKKLLAWARAPRLGMDRRARAASGRRTEP